MGERIVAAMSGGVDSSVAAALLVERGYEVIGVTLRLRRCREDPGGDSCCGADGPAQARAVADRLGIPHYRIDAFDEFDSWILRPAWDEYARGRTPDPCIACNERIKFGWLLDRARAVGASRVATGHYARLARAPDDGPVLRRGADRNKDQSYFLFQLRPDQLDAALFPLGGMTKPQVREEARRRGFGNAERRDSQNACLGGPGETFPEALRKRYGGEARPGDVVDPAGRVVGRHAGIHRYTPGQRRGLGSAIGRRAWVREVDAASARVTITSEPDDLLADVVEASGARRHRPLPDGEPVRCSAQVRYRLTPIEATAVFSGDRLTVRFHRAVRAAAPGQAIVLYDDDVVLGGGWIDAVSRGEGRP
jgi:tRNA-specific 2-thiouridylase